jgi:PKD repeat protein
MKRFHLLGPIVLLVTLVLAGPADAAPPTADFTISPTTARVSSPVSFSASAAGQGGATISSYAWNFGDGASDSGASVSHAYGPSSTGTKSVTLTVTDSNGETTSVSHGLSVVGLPVALFTFAPATPNTGGTVSFNAAASGDPAGSIKSYSWNFGDGATASGVNPSHAYATSGDKTVTLTITASLDDRTATTSRVVHVNIPPTASFVFAAVVVQPPPPAPPNPQDPFTPLVGQNIAFSAQGSGDSDGSITAYDWDLGTGSFDVHRDGTVPFLIAPIPTAGQKTVRLRVTDNNGATSIAAVSMRINTPPTASFTFAPDAPETGQVVQFTAVAGDPDGAADVKTISWDLNGDGTYGDATGPNASAVFLSARDDYTVGVQVTDAGGAQTAFTRTLSIKGPPKPQPAPGTGSSGSPGNPVVIASPGAPLMNTTPFSDPGSAPATAASTSPQAKAAVAGVRVQMAGSVTGGFTRITSLVVVGPVGATVKLSCRGKGCPKKAIKGTIGRRGSLRIRPLERHTLRAGGTIIVTVSKAGFVPRRTEIKLRRGRAPLRTEGCLVATKTGKGTGPCPA